MLLGIYGSGGFGREVKEIAEICNLWDELVFIDDTVEAGIFQGLKRMPFDFFGNSYGVREAEVVIALGEPEYKRELYEKVKKKGYSFANVIDPRSNVSISAKMGKGIVIYAGAFVSSNVIIEDNVCIGLKTIIGHDCVVHQHCQIAPGVILGGRCIIECGTYIGMGVPVKEDITVGADAIVGMGSVVLRDIPENVIALGNPARAMKHKDDKKVFQ